MSKLPGKLPYDHDMFVGRRDELEVVLGKARRIVAGLPVERRVIIFHGRRGSGKTWLLREQEYCLCHEIGKEIARFVDLGEYVKVAAIKAQIPEQRPLVLLMDDVNEADEKRLEALEEQVLAPLGQKPDVLIVLAERGRPYFWTTPEFREKSDEFDLDPFKPDDIKEQIEKQSPEAAAYAEEIAEIGGGFPWSTYILAQSLPDKVTALEHCVTMFLQDWKDEPDLRSYVEALCILKAFDETRMAILLPAYSSEFAGRTWNYAACRKVRENLVATTLALWDGDARGYVIDESLQIVLEAVLRERDLDLWTNLHCVAYQLYADWAKKYEQSREYWEKEKQHHARRLRFAGFNPADCPEEESQEEGEK